MDSAAQHLRPELEYRLRLILQEAWKFCRRARRTILTGDDIFIAWQFVCGDVSSASHGLAHIAKPGSTLGLLMHRAMLQPGSQGFGTLHWF